VLRIAPGDTGICDETESGIVSNFALLKPLLPPPTLFTSPEPKKELVPVFETSG